jgi:hypothetical protein
VDRSETRLACHRRLVGYRGEYRHRLHDFASICLIQLGLELELLASERIQGCLGHTILYPLFPMLRQVHDERISAVCILRVDVKEVGILCGGAR